jgi:hypothetical protein
MIAQLEDIHKTNIMVVQEEATATTPMEIIEVVTVKVATVVDPRVMTPMAVATEAIVGAVKVAERDLLGKMKPRLFSWETSALMLMTETSKISSRDREFPA